MVLRAPIIHETGPPRRRFEDSRELLQQAVFAQVESIIESLPPWRRAEIRGRIPTFVSNIMSTINGLNALGAGITPAAVSGMGDIGGLIRSQVSQADLSAARRIELIQQILHQGGGSARLRAAFAAGMSSLPLAWQRDDRESPGAVSGVSAAVTLAAFSRGVSTLFSDSPTGVRLHHNLLFTDETDFNTRIRAVPLDHGVVVTVPPARIPPNSADFSDLEDRVGQLEVIEREMENRGRRRRTLLGEDPDSPERWSDGSTGTRVYVIPGWQTPDGRAVSVTVFPPGNRSIVFREETPGSGVASGMMLDGHSHDTFSDEDRRLLERHGVPLRSNEEIARSLRIQRETAAEAEAHRPPTEQELADINSAVERFRTPLITGSSMHGADGTAMSPEEVLARAHAPEPPEVIERRRLAQEARDGLADVLPPEEEARRIRLASERVDAQRRLEAERAERQRIEAALLADATDTTYVDPTVDGSILTSSLPPGHRRLASLPGSGHRFTGIVRTSLGQPHALVPPVLTGQTGIVQAGVTSAVVTATADQPPEHNSLTLAVNSAAPSAAAPTLGV
jgi:hypothetical protein